MSEVLGTNEKCARALEWRMIENNISFLESVSFRLIATLTTVVLVFVFTSEIVISLQVGSVEFFAKIGVYYFHERLSNMLGFWRK